ncbi:MAG: glycosyltransferase family 2 protein [Flavobacterium sp.]
MINTLPLITIITVVYNGFDTIENTVVDVLNQTYKNIEYIIIDGGSTDGTVDVIKKYQNQISYWISEPDNGIYDAMNKGWAKANKDSYIIFLGSGDKIICLPNMDLYKDVDVVFGDVSLGEHRIFKSTIGWRSYFGNTIHHQAMLVKKRLNMEPPFSLEYKIYSDFDFNQRLLKKGVNFQKDDNFHGFALEGGVSEQLDIKEVVKIVKKNHGYFMSKLALLYFELQKINGIRKNNSSSSTL